MTELEVAPSRVQHSISGAVYTKTLGTYWITMGQRHNDQLPPHRQSWRNRLPYHPHRARDGHSHCRGLFGRRRQGAARPRRSEEHTSELQSLMRISYAVFCLKKKKTTTHSL